MTILRDGNAQHALSATHSTRSLQRTARAHCNAQHALSASRCKVRGGVGGCPSAPQTCRVRTGSPPGRARFGKGAGDYTGGGGGGGSGVPGGHVRCYR